MKLMLNPFLLSILFCCFGLSCLNKTPQPGRSSALATDTFSVMAYNVEGVFDLTNDGCEYPEFIPGNANWNVKTWRIKLDNIASVIAEVKPAIVFLSEIENDRALGDLQKAISEKDVSYSNKYAAVKSANSAVTVGILSQFRILAATQIPIQLPRNTLTRPLLIAKIDCNGFPLYVFGVHFPSQQHPESYRIAVAKVLLERIAFLPPHAEYCILGDFNEGYDVSESIIFTKNNDCNGKTALTDILQTKSINQEKNRPLFTTSSIIGSQPFSHVDLWVDVLYNKRQSYVYQGKAETIDHILLPERLFDSSGLSYVNKSFGAMQCGGRLMRDGVPFRWQFRYANKRKFHTGEGYSDHLPVVVTLCKGPYFESDPVNKTRADTSSDSSENLQPSESVVLSSALDQSQWKSASALFASEINESKKLVTIKGMLKKNGCIVQCRVKQESTKIQFLKFVLKGNGKLNIRTRMPGAKFCYYNGPTFKPAKSGRYSVYDYSQYHRVNLLLPKNEVGPWEVEVRGAADVQIVLEIGEVTAQ